MLKIDTTTSLNNGKEMPLFGLGVYQVEEKGDSCYNAVRWALDAGYRSIDTAKLYANESAVGRAVRDSGIPRDQVFVTTKLWNTDHGYDNTLKAYDKSLTTLDLDYIDLYLVHYPVFGPRLETWKAMEEISQLSSCHAIGVSNYMPQHMNELLANCTIPPAVNQIELSPYNFKYRNEIVTLCRSNNIQLEAYCPLTRAKKLADPKLVVMAQKYGKTTAQILVRWALEEQIVVIPKSSNKGRIEENANVFDFEISEEDMETLNGFDEQLITSWDPTDAP